MLGSYRVKLPLAHIGRLPYTYVRRLGNTVRRTRETDMTIDIVCQTPEMANQLRDLFLIEEVIRESNIRVAQDEANGARFVVIDAGFPRKLWLIWDCLECDNLRGEQMGKRNARFPYMTTKAAAQKIADRHNKRVAKEG